MDIGGALDIASLALCWRKTATNSKDTPGWKPISMRLPEASPWRAAWILVFRATAARKI